MAMARPKRAPKPEQSAYTADEMRYIAAWFDMVEEWQRGNMGAWQEVYGRLDEQERAKREVAA